MNHTDASFDRAQDRPYGKADLHVHTASGDGMAEPWQLLEYVEEETDLTVIAITDHDDIRGALLVRELWAQGHYRFEVVLGEEVTTQEGHLLALFIQEPLPSLRPLAETIEAVHKQGGLCIVPHPLSWLTRSIGHRTIQATLRHPDDLVYLDGIELANETLGARISRRRAQRLNREVYRLAEVGGSDAHFLAAVSSAYTLFAGSTAHDLRRCILEGSTRAVNGRHPSLAQIGAGQVLRQTWRGLVTTPRTVGWLRTARSFVKLILRI